MGAGGAWHGPGNTGFRLASPQGEIGIKRAAFGGGEIAQRNFTVLPPDPHRFDGDKDGVGCES